MKIILAGGSGFIGSALQKALALHEVIVLSRNPQKANEVYWDAKTIGDWVKKLEQADAIINLSGKSINSRQTSENKAEILSSRIDSTNIIGEAIAQCTHPPKYWMNACGAFSNAKPDEQYRDFALEVSEKWERAFFNFSHLNLKQTSLRTTIVVDKNGGAYPLLYRLAQWGLGGKQGSGKQWVSWIHLQDYINVILFLLKNDVDSPVIHMTSPNPLMNKDFMRAIRQKSAIRIGIPTPAFLLKLGSLIIGTDPNLALNSIYSLPYELLDSGFKFEVASMGDF